MLLLKSVLKLPSYTPFYFQHLSDAHMECCNNSPYWILAFNMNHKVPFFAFFYWPHIANECKQSRIRGLEGTFLRRHTNFQDWAEVWVRVSHFGTILQSPRGAWVSPITRDARGSGSSRQQAHAGKLGWQEGVQDKDHRLWARVEVEHLEEEEEEKKQESLGSERKSVNIRIPCEQNWLVVLSFSPVISPI